MMIKVALALALSVGWWSQKELPELPPFETPQPRAEQVVVRETAESPVPRLVDQVLAAAKAYAGARVPYQMSYPDIDYPGGDLDAGRGLCCDVVVRSFRAAGIDLQPLVYEDSQLARGEYLQINRRTGFSRPLNRSWVHRRTSNLNLFFERQFEVLPTQYNTTTADTFHPGDIVIYVRNGWETWHIGLVSDTASPQTGEPMLIDAWLEPGYASESHRLTSHGPIAGHYRLPENFLDRLPPDHVWQARESWNRFAQAFLQPTALDGMVGEAIPSVPQLSHPTQMAFPFPFRR